jgi:hypothetical protein
MGAQLLLTDFYYKSNWKLCIVTQHSSTADLTKKWNYFSLDRNPTIVSPPQYLADSAGSA